MNVEQIKRWEFNQRYCYKKGWLAPYQIKIMESAGFRWKEHDFISFVEAKKFVHSLKLKSQSQWRKYCQSILFPKTIPKEPRKVYKKEFTTIGDWLGTNRVSDNLRKYLSYEEAKIFAHSLKLNSSQEYKKWWKQNQPTDISSCPNKTYKNKGWSSWGEWLGTGTIAPQYKEFLSFKDAKRFIHSLKLKTQKEWNKYYISEKKPIKIPSAPTKVYKKEWVSWNDWLGK